MIKYAKLSGGGGGGGGLQPPNPPGGYGHELILSNLHSGTKFSGWLRRCRQERI